MADQECVEVRCCSCFEGESCSRAGERFGVPGAASGTRVVLVGDKSGCCCCRAALIAVGGRVEEGKFSLSLAAGLGVVPTFGEASS